MANNIDLTIVEIKNPTSQDFSWRWNGELYTIKAGETKSFAKPVAFHLAKHLSTKMVSDDALKGVKQKDLENPNSAIHVKVAQLNTYDTHERRIALFQILNDVDAVVEVIQRYPFKGFIGEMDKYQEFVEKATKKEVPEVTNT